MGIGILTRGRWSILFGIVASTLVGCAVLTPPGFDIPRGVEVNVLLGPTGSPSTSLPDNVAFDVDLRGRPFLAADNTLVGLSRPKPLIALDVPRVEDFAWMPDGTLLLLSERRLLAVDARGQIAGPDLPAADMHVRPGSNMSAYLFGGSQEPANHDVYLLVRGGAITKLFRAPQPVKAVAGNGKTTYIAVGPSVLRFEWNRPLEVVFEASDPITSLELAPQEGFFYSTGSGAGYVGPDGGDLEFLKGYGGYLRVRGSALFILIPQGPYLLKLSPVHLFEEVVRGRSTR